MNRKIFVSTTIAILFGLLFVPIGSCLDISFLNEIKDTECTSVEKTYYDVSFSSSGRFKYIFNFFPTFILNVNIEGEHSSMLISKIFSADYDGIEIEGTDSKISCSYPAEINNPYFDAITYIDGDSYFGEHKITVYGFDGKVTIREESGSTEVPFRNDFFILNGKADRVVIIE